MDIWDHPNKDRTYRRGTIHNAPPGEKGFRRPIPWKVQKVANEVRRLMTVFQLTNDECIAMVKDHFGEGIGFQTFRMFLDPIYGVAFNPRKATLKKWKYLKKLLGRIEKELQNPSSILELKAVSPVGSKTNKQKQPN